MTSIKIPVQFHGVPAGWGSQISRQSTREGSVPPRKYSWYWFVLEAESIPGLHSTAGRIKSMENSTVTIGNRTRHLRDCNTVTKPTAPPRVPHQIIKRKEVQSRNNDITTAESRFTTGDKMKLRKKMGNSFFMCSPSTKQYVYVHDTVDKLSQGIWKICKRTLWKGIFHVAILNAISVTHTHTHTHSHTHNVSSNVCLRIFYNINFMALEVSKTHVYLNYCN